MTTTKTRRATDAAQLTLSLTTPILSDAQQAERPDRETRLAAAQAVLSRGLAGVRDDPQALANYLQFAARFHSYSARNLLLIYLQRPTARFLMGFRTWTKHGRRVRKGERGITILAPVLRRPTKAERAAGDDDERVVGYSTATVFDYAQTDATRDDALEYVPPVPRLDAEGPDGLLAKLVTAAEQIGCKVHYSTLGGYADGWYREADRTIAVRASLSCADRCSVLTHELAHAVAHSQGAPEATAVLTSQSRASKELQAEGAAYVALSALGLDTARTSLPYLKSWADGDDALAAELAAIDLIARRLLALVGAA